MPKRINGRNKGAAGEREAGAWLQHTFNLEHKPERNLEQVRSGGHDLIGFYPFWIEVKRQETLAYQTWWVQAVVSARKSGDDNAEPVVMFRQNRKDWEFLISARHLDLGPDARLDRGYLHVSRHVFIGWANGILNRIAMQEPHQPFPLSVS